MTDLLKWMSKLKTNIRPEWKVLAAIYKFSFLAKSSSFSRKLEARILLLFHVISSRKFRAERERKRERRVRNRNIKTTMRNFSNIWLRYYRNKNMQQGEFCTHETFPSLFCRLKQEMWFWKWMEPTFIAIQRKRVSTANSSEERARRSLWFFSNGKLTRKGFLSIESENGLFDLPFGLVHWWFPENYTHKKNLFRSHLEFFSLVIFFHIISHLSSSSLQCSSVYASPLIPSHWNWKEVKFFSLFLHFNRNSFKHQSHFSQIQQLRITLGHIYQRITVSRTWATRPLTIHRHQDRL